MSKGNRELDLSECRNLTEASTETMSLLMADGPNLSNEDIAIFHQTMEMWMRDFPERSPSPDDQTARVEAYEAGFKAAIKRGADRALAEMMADGEIIRTEDGKYDFSKLEKELLDLGVSRS